MPKFSIIVPLHNSASFCRKCLDSVRDQTFKDYELIIICDKCTDNSAEIAREYTDNVIITEYGNCGMSRNAGLDKAVGEWVLFLDDDDWWLHEYVLEQINAKLMETGNIDWLCFSFIFRHWMYAEPHHPGGGAWIAIWCKCWRRAFIGDIRFDNTYPSDVSFHHKALAKHPRIYEWDMPMYYYNYMHEGSQTYIHSKGGK